MRPIENIVKRYAEIARPVMRKYMGPHSCIGAARLTIECLGRLGVPAIAVPTKVAVRLPKLNLAFTYGSTPEELATASEARPAAFIEEGTGWQGHVLVVTRNPGAVEFGDFVLDPTIDWALLELGFPQPDDEPILLVPIPSSIKPHQMHLECQGLLNDGTEVEFEYFATDDHSFVESEAWNDEALPLIAYEILSLVGPSARI